MKSAIEALITLRVYYDMARMDRLHMVSLFNDLRGCYDRIRPALNTITMRRMGCPKSWVECQTRALRGMKHAIRTSFGITKEVISNDGENNLGGIGQGAGDGPSSWHSHMLPLIDAFEELIPHRATFISPDKKIIISQWLIGFVDDNTIIFTMKDTHFKAAIEEKLMEMADEVLDTWQKLVVITGGDIELDKSGISIIAWEIKRKREYDEG